MKKLFFIMLLLSASLSLFAIDLVSLPPLKENEHLRLNYKNRILNIEKISDDKEELYYSCESFWGAWFISSDKRKVLIYGKGMYSIYLLDGNTGTITYKGEVNQTSFPDGSFKYLITSTIVPEDEMLNLSIWDLETMKELYNFPWLSQKENFKKYGWLYYIFYKSLDPKYDFVIYVYGESEDSFGYMLLNATTREYEEHLFDPPREVPMLSYFECGWE